MVRVEAIACNLGPSRSWEGTYHEAMRQTVPAGALQESKVDPDEIRDRFRHLFDVWDKDTFIFSFPYQIFNHWAYEELVSLGEPAVPYMLGELQRGYPDIVRALRTISGESLVQGLGLTTEEVMERWLAWGVEKGHVPTVA